MNNEQVYKELELDIKELEDFHNDFSSILRVIRKKGLSFAPIEKDGNTNNNPDLKKLIDTLKASNIIENYKLDGQEIENKNELYKKIKNSIDSGNPVVGSFFYGTGNGEEEKEKEKEEKQEEEEEEKEEEEQEEGSWHAMTFLGYTYNDNTSHRITLSDISGFIVINTWDVRIAGYYYGFFTLNKLERCMRKYYSDGGIYYRILTVKKEKPAKQSNTKA